MRWPDSTYQLDIAKALHTDVFLYTLYIDVLPEVPEIITTAIALVVYTAYNRLHLLHLHRSLSVCSSHAFSW